MDVIPLSQLRLGIQYCLIRVMISRVWEFRGKSDDEPVKHLDLVIIDEKKTSMYVEILADVIEILKTNLVEGRVVTIKKFIVHHARTLFKVVQHPYMIKLNRRTEITPVDPQPQNFPRHVYSLINFSDLDHYLNMTAQFLDVIGQVVAVSNVAAIKSFGKMQTKRIVKLKDLSGHIIELSLWGSRATEFQGDQIYEVGQKDAVIVLFVGTLWKSHRGETPFLSGTSACHWYINDESIPEIRNFYASLPNEVDPIEMLQLANSNNNQDEVRQKTLLELKDADPFEEKTNRFECTVTITRLTPNQKWFYPACQKCHSRTNLSGPTYTCTNKECSCTEMEYRYKLSLMGSDDTFELEFILFEQSSKFLAQMQLADDKMDIETMGDQTGSGVAGSKRPYDSTTEDSEDDDAALGTYGKRTKKQ
ncbi:replication protein A 70 kDa DNA-binding subunit C-like [Phragmites australis]|uniref:replication protein A 70 kDa DNA-binding subunit C-like n=1 Tax=Phragmites australis TaxID=29695 RepID=UPI002D78FBAD|nr:replication protein A 70 kDa DNA-binding subunit C-like [Phragmites australis]